MVIGLGSPFGDDRAGWAVAERLAALPAVATRDVQVALCRSPGSELPGLLAAAEVAILVDAVRYRGAPGTVYRWSRPEPSLFGEARLSSHGLGLRAGLELAQALGDLPREWLLYGIEAGPGREAGSVITAVDAVAWVVAAIRRDIDYFRHGGERLSQ